MMISGFLSRATQLLAAPLLMASLLAGPALAGDAARVPERQRPSFPQLNLQVKQAQGQDAVSRLGASLPAVADWYGKSPDELRRQLLSDLRMRVDSRGRLFVVDELEKPLGAVTSGNQQNVMDGTLLPLDQTFKLHSRPGANLTIYLDFDGATITGTAWNSSASTITAKPFDLDNVVSTTFSTAEMERIRYIWQRVAEDYAPFDVDVTTEPPTYDQLHRNDSTDPVFGTTVVITNNTGVYSCSCGGVAYVGVFNSTSDFYKPALVFYNMLAAGDEKSVAEAISHEAGHNMGLSHDGVTGNPYYGGQGTDATTGWAPIMGVGYSKPLVQFSKGEYTGATNTEDDFVKAQSFGLALRPDDYGNTIAAAAPFQAAVNGSTTSGTMNGVVETATDADMFALAAGAGTLTVSAVPAKRSPNADLVVTLFNSAGTVLTTSNPLNALNGSFTYQLPAQGSYYLQVKGTGQGDPATTGYSSYGSVGNYQLSASYTSTGSTPPTPVLSATPTTGTAPLAVTLDGRGSTDADGIKFYYWDFGDGTTNNTGTLTNTTKTYNNAGTFTVRLTVVDNTGLSASTTKSISVASATVQNSAKVLLPIPMSISTSRTGYATASGTVTVVNQSGAVLAGASVAATWSGIVSRSSTGTTSSTGRVTFSSPSTKSRGCFTLTITKVTLTGYSFTQSPLPSAQICR